VSNGSVRVYIPATTTLLRELVDDGELRASVGSPLVAFAVTDGLRSFYDDEDDESLEYAALSESARASLRLIEADPSALRRRVVIAADIAADQVLARDDLDRGVVQVRVSVPMNAVLSAHVDDADAQEVIARAASSMLAAELGDERAQDAVDDAEGYELGWYATQEIGLLLDLA
jgi:hypothetical protein